MVEEFDKDTKIGYRTTFSDWSSRTGSVDGQFCSPKSSGWYPDPDQPDLLFIKFNTAVRGSPRYDENRRRRRELGNGSSSGVAIDVVDADGTKSGYGAA